MSKSHINGKKIAFIIGSMKRGGAERVISILANHYSNKGWKVDIILLLDSKCEYILHENIRLISLYYYKKARFLNLPIWIHGLRKYFKKCNPDRIVSFIARINILALLANLGINKPVIISERNDPASDGRSLFVKFLTYILYPFADNIIFQTNWAKSCFPGYIRRKGVIIPNPIRVSAKVKDKKNNKIVAVGRLAEQKNHRLLIDAFKNVVNHYPDYKLYIYGEGELRNDLEKYIKKLDLTDKVFLPGSVSDIHQQISDAKMFVLSSNFEGLSNALLEAMMMGIPCISTECAGSTEVIISGINGLLVPIGNKEALTKSMLRFIEDEEFSKYIGINAAISVKIFEEELFVNKWEKLIEKNIY